MSGCEPYCPCRSHYYSGGLYAAHQYSTTVPDGLDAVVQGAAFAVQEADSKEAWDRALVDTLGRSILDNSSCSVVAAFGWVANVKVPVQ